ncbi:hypothetical protein EJB05_37475, partial [Eragrostis curvula]
MARRFLDDDCFATAVRDGSTAAASRLNGKQQQQMAVVLRTPWSPCGDRGSAGDGDWATFRPVKLSGTGWIRGFNKGENLRSHLGSTVMDPRQEVMFRATLADKTKHYEGMATGQMEKKTSSRCGRRLWVKIGSCTCKVSGGSRAPFWVQHSLANDHRDYFKQQWKGKLFPFRENTEEGESDPNMPKSSHTQFIDI